MHDVLTRSIGWYGKLPWVGDFVGQGLPWQRLWDEWLQRGLPAAEATLGSAALRNCVRGMAPWQGLLLPADGQGMGWCGIVAGSRDRVGRVFPLLLAEGVPRAALDAVPLVRLQARMLGLSDWLWDAARFESVEEFEQGAAAWAGSDWPQVTEAPGGAGVVVDRVADLRRSCPGAASFWWPTEPVPDVRQPIAESWPPSDGLLLRMLG
ncbi:type VI secretion system-associated protein TagF [Aquincola sp. S2]|uniref:Type VI secretion system-associated protein TagF n=1 Tax=Pseudaquabacterium terrae TaxID=2732868 RepID=A0ABX2EF07_9BURK|nr:type VI secretion system-associated protein TagF [Aquabacterium terrae]NRF67180.1 type VI secretion system-associated protein TagF [Aquabacterium terrae]